MKTIQKIVWYFFSLLLVAGCSSNKNLPKQSAEYAASPIYFLDQNVNAVVKDYDAHLEINADDHAVYSVHKAVTISNPDAREHARLTLGYGGFQNILSVEGAIYSGDGTLIRYLNENDGLDISLSGGYSLYEDTRIKTYQLYHDDYPYTVVYDYKIEFTGLLSLPSFLPQNPNQFVEHARLKVRAPINQPIRYRTLNIKQPPIKSVTAEDSLLTWEFKKMKPVKNEPFDPTFSEKAPRILFATEQFRMANSTGKLDSWNSFGQWYYGLSKGRDELPQTVKREVTAIYENAADRTQGIKALYEYMQEKTRYVSIQLGIGGWQPFEANFVEEKGYGDCKALTNYMYSILKAAGVESYPVLIRNGVDEPPIVADFPSNQFNHVVLYVPGDEPIWLETTSQSIPFNYIGTGNANRYGLMVKADTSMLVKTPDYDHSVNKWENNITMQLSEEGKADISLESIYSGYYLDDVLRNAAQKSQKDREEWLHETISLNAFTIKSSDFGDVDSKKAAPAIRLDIENEAYATRTGDRLFVPLNKINKWSYRFPEMDKKRNREVRLSFSFEELDHTVIKIPEGFEVESLPSSAQLKTSFGLFRLNIRQTEGGNLEIERALTITRNKLEPKEYPELRSFFAEVSSTDSKNIVLRAE